MKTTKLDTYAQFLEFNRRNPALYDFFVERAREARDSGYKRYGFPLLFNLARWEFGVKARNSDFELDNDIAPYYARVIQMREPDLFGFFEVRASAADWQTGWDKFKQTRTSPAPTGVTVTQVDVTAEPLPPAKPVKKVYIIDDDDNVVTRYA